MGLYKITMPEMGQAIKEAKISNWCKTTGENIQEDEILFEITTDKEESEIPSPVSGKLVKINFEEGEVVKVGQVIGVIETT